MRTTSIQRRRLAVLAAVLPLAAIFALCPWLLTDIFSSTYLPHGFCFRWNPRLLWLHVISDSIIWVSYTAIALTLVVLVQRIRKLIGFKSIFFLFGAFILACGVTHFLEVVVLWRPLYWLQGDVKFLTACASLITAVALPFCVRQVKAVLEKAAVSAENERRFLAAVDSSLDSFYIFESIRGHSGEIVDFRFAFVNAVGARLLSHGPDQLIGQALCEAFPEHRPLGLFEKYKAVADTGEALSGEFAIHIPAANVTWLNIQAVKLDDGLAISVQDISERKRLEMERGAAFAESLIGRSPAAIIVTDAEYTIRSVNPAARAMLQYTQEDLILRNTPLIFFDPSEVQALVDRLTGESGVSVSPYQAIFAANPRSMAGEAGEWTFLRKDGSPLAVEATVTPLKTDNCALSGFMVTAYDISERRRREAAAAKAAIELEAINRSQMLVELDMEGTVLQANDNYLRAFGYEASDLEGQNYSLLVPAEEWRSEKHKKLWEGLRAGRFQHGEFQRLGRNGREVWIEASYNPILDENGTPSRVVTFAADVSERVQMQGAIRDAENQTRAILNNILDGIITIDADGAIASVNPAAVRMFGYESLELIGHNVKMLMPEPDQGSHDHHLARYESTGKTRIIGVGRELDGLTKSGQTFPMELTVTEISFGRQRLFVGVVRDITDRKRAEHEARRARAFRESIIEHSPAAIIVTDMEFTIVAINPAAQKMLWYQPDELVGHATPLIFYSHTQVEDRAKRLSAASGAFVELDRAIFATGPDPGGHRDGEWTFFRKGGSTVVVQVNVTPLSGEDGEPSGFMITAYDISERKRREDYISHLAHHDVLTGLPTRQLLMDRLEMMITRTRRFNNRSALFMIDLNNFKQVNDSLGHHVGDRLLVQVAERLRGAVRAVDTVARMGGDEFVVLASDLESAASAEQVGRKLLAAFNAPFALKEQSTMAVAASIGICIYPEGGTDASTLLRNADIAMYYAKATRGHSYQLYTEEIAGSVVRQREMEAALAAALDNGELSLQYQPQFSIADGNMVGVEALLRWNSRQFGPVIPAHFIPVAETSGLILPIGTWVIRTACRELRRFQAQFGADFIMAVNLSSRQIDQPDLLRVIEGALVENGLAPACLELEITESQLMSDSSHANVFFEALHELGVRVAIDDFGTGFSSMAYLLRFSVNRLKIDRCFIQDVHQNPNSATVTSAIIALAHQLKASVIAEGIESEAQMEFLRGADCDDAQGYHLCRPKSADEIVSAFTPHAVPR